MALEFRAFWDLGAVLPAWPFLRQAPAGDGHSVIVFPGLSASDASTLPMRSFLENLGHDVSGWNQGSNFGPRAGVLQAAVPGLAADYAHRVLKTVLGRAGLEAADVKTWIMHAGGRDVLLAVERELGLGPQDLRYSAAMLYEYGNLSSAFVYFVLEAALADHAPDGWWWLSSFGAGFSCHGALLKVSA